MIGADKRAELIARAREVRLLAYAPYSGYSVGAALLARSGRIYVGANVENAAYPSSMCAERTAVFTAASEGERSFEAIAVVTENGASPCGACRQVLSEFGTEALVIVADLQGNFIQKPLAEWLPAAFGPDDLPTRPDPHSDG